MPTTVPNTRRQKLTTRDGVDLQRAYVFMKEESWELLNGLCRSTNQSNSQVIEALVVNATRGNLKVKNDANAVSKN